VQTILALLWLPVGFVIGLFVSAQIIIPITMGLPRAIRLVSRGEMRSGVYGRLLLTPVLWIVQLSIVLFVIGYFWPSAAAWLEHNGTLNLGIWVGVICILLSPISKKSRADFRADFDRSYGRFYTGIPSNRVTRTTMTFGEAERILDIVSVALQDTRHGAQHPVSSLHGYDIFDICIALKLRIANEFLLLSGRPDFEAQFEEGLSLYDGVPWQIMGTFVVDEEIGQISPKLAMGAIDPATMTIDKRFAEHETGRSLGDFCKTLGPADPNYWRHVYERIGIEYTSDSPSGNRPVRP